jgi:hypothetical protein
MNSSLASLIDFSVISNCRRNDFVVMSLLPSFAPQLVGRAFESECEQSYKDSCKGWGVREVGRAGSA